MPDAWQMVVGRRLIARSCNDNILVIMFLHCICLWMNWWTWHARLFGDMYSAVFFYTPNTMNVYIYIQPNIFKFNMRFNENGVSSAWRNGVSRFQLESQRFKAESLKVWYVGYPWKISQSCRCKPPIYPLKLTNCTWKSILGIVGRWYPFPFCG